jgi:hypothetical protein
MEYAKDTELKGILIFHLGIQKDKKDVAYVRYSFSGMEINIALVVTIS